jgi:hypothetical protein
MYGSPRMYAISGLLFSPTNALSGVRLRTSDGAQGWTAAHRIARRLHGLELTTARLDLEWANGAANHNGNGELGAEQTDCRERGMTKARSGADQRHDVATRDDGTKPVVP